MSTEKKPIKKVIYLGYAPLSIKIEKDFYLNELQEEHIEVEYWDLTQKFFPNQIFSDSLEKTYIKKIPTLDKFKKTLQSENLDTTFFISLIGYEWRSLHLHLILSTFKCRIGFFARGMLPIYNLSFKNKLLIKFRYFFTPRNIFDYALNLLAYFLRSKTFIGHYEVVFVAGNIAKNTYKHLAQKLVPCNHFDYDYTLQLENISTSPIRYALFLDEFLSGHPDFQMQNAKTVSEKNYFHQMNAFFTKIEKAFDLKVIIASHPKADYAPVTFGDRKIIKYKTAELAKNAEFLIAHISTSIGFATIYKKPLLLTYTQELQDVNPGYVNYIYSFGKTLNCNVIKVDDILQQTNRNEPIELLKEIDDIKYQDYFFNYLTSEKSVCTQTNRIFLNYLKDNKQ